jgi:hypothetical protein
MMSVVARVIATVQYHFVIAVWRAKTHDSGREMRATFAVIVTVCFATIAPADDFKTIDGKEYKNVKVSRVEPDGIVLKSKSGISKVYFTELPKEVQERFHYDAATSNAYSAEQNANLEALRKQQAAATGSQKANVTPATSEPMATSGIEGLPPITVGLKDELLNALKMTDKLDALYKRGCSSAEFIAAGLPVEPVFLKLQNKLPKGDPRRDLLMNTFLAYQNAGVVMKANTGERPDATIATARFRKHLLTKILEGNMTAEDKEFYYGWRKALETNP